MWRSAGSFLCCLMPIIVANHGLGWHWHLVGQAWRTGWDQESWALTWWALLPTSCKVLCVSFINGLHFYISMSNRPTACGWKKFSSFSLATSAWRRFRFLCLPSIKLWAWRAIMEKWLSSPDYRHTWQLCAGCLNSSTSRMPSCAHCGGCFLLLSTCGATAVSFMRRQLGSPLWSLRGQWVQALSDCWMVPTLQANVWKGLPENATEQIQNLLSSPLECAWPLGRSDFECLRSWANLEAWKQAVVNSV